MGNWLWGLLIAVQFLTRIPITGIPEAAFQDSNLRRSLIFFPMVGVLVGLIGMMVWWIAHQIGLGPWPTAILTVAATASVTGAFHEDGLADTFDALGAYTRERSLEIMRDSRIGTFGAVALWVGLTLKASALVSLPPPMIWKALLCAHLLARWSSLPLALALPYARETKGLGAGIAALVTRHEVFWATLVTLGILLALAGPRAALPLIVLASALTALTGLFYRRRFGGVTGDCLGATNQIVEIATLLLFTLPFWRTL